MGVRVSVEYAMIAARFSKLTQIVVDFAVAVHTTTLQPRVPDQTKQALARADFGSASQA